MSNKLNHQIFINLSQNKQKAKKKEQSLHHYKTIIVKNSKRDQRSHLNIKSRLGLIASTLPQIAVKSHRQTLTIQKSTNSNNKQSLTSLKIVKQPNKKEISINKHVLFPKSKRINLESQNKRNARSQSIKKIIKNQTKLKQIKRQQISRINQNLIFQRRQNYLNSYFNQRKNKLKEINKQNKKIYEKINSQKSLYSSKQLNKSFQSNRSISNSKISKRSRLSSVSKSISTSRASLKKNNANCKNQLNQRKNIITIQYQNIKNLKAQEVNKFATLFTKQNVPKILAKSSSKQNKHLQIPIVTKNKLMKNTQKSNFKQQQVLRSKTRSMFGDIQNKDCGILHRIIQQQSANKANYINSNKILY